MRLRAASAAHLVPRLLPPALLLLPLLLLLLLLQRRLGLEPPKHILHLHLPLRGPVVAELEVRHVAGPQRSAHRRPQLGRPAAGVAGGGVGVVRRWLLSEADSCGVGLLRFRDRSTLLSQQ